MDEAFQYLFKTFFFTLNQVSFSEIENLSVLYLTVHTHHNFLLVVLCVEF